MTPVPESNYVKIRLRANGRIRSLTVSRSGVYNPRGDQSDGRCIDRQGFYNIGRLVVRPHIQIGDWTKGSD
jgi:hypothetical protein